MGQVLNKATLADAQAGTDSVKYITPAVLAEAEIPFSSILVNGTYTSLQDPMIQVESAAGPSISLYSTTAGSKYQWITGYVGAMLELYTNSVANGDYDTLLLKVNQDLEWTIYGDVYMPQTLRTETLTVDLMSARKGTFTNIVDGLPSLDLRSTNPGWGGDIDFTNSNGTNYSWLAGSINRFYVGSSGPLVLSNLASTVGVSLDFETDGLLKVMNRDANALANLQASAITAVSTITATVLATPTFKTWLAGNASIGPSVEFDFIGDRFGFCGGEVDGIFPTKAQAQSDDQVTLGGPTNRFSKVYTKTIKAGSHTVATLPAAVSNEGHRTYVTDANAAMSGNFGAIVAGGGSNKVPVFCDGTNWRIG